MAADKPIGRMTLQELLTSGEKCCRSLIDHCHNELMKRVAEFRELTRPVRRRSHYPTLAVVQSSVKNLQEANEDVQALANILQQQCSAIRDHVLRERISKSG